MIKLLLPFVLATMVGTMVTIVVVNQVYRWKKQPVKHHFDKSIAINEKKEVGFTNTDAVCEKANDEEFHPYNC